MRNRFAQVLEGLMDSDDRVILLYGDIGNRLFDSIKAKYPSRALNCGVAEANMVSLAAGLESIGFRPVVYTISSFLYLKGLEQIKLDACYANRSIIFVGTGGGLSYAGLGATHHSLEDFAVLGSLPEIALFSPADNYELEIVLRHALNHGGPAWIRLGKKGEPDVHPASLEINEKWPLPPQQLTLKSTNKATDRITVFSTGLLVYESVKAADRLIHMGFSVEVWSVPQLKPFPASEIRAVVGQSRCVFTAEEHVPMGGLYSLVLSSLNSDFDHVVHSINSGDHFHSASGSAVSARKRRGLDSEGIFSTISGKLLAP
jgi:transketolase